MPKTALQVCKERRRKEGGKRESQQNVLGINKFFYEGHEVKMMSPSHVKDIQTTMRHSFVARGAGQRYRMANV